MMPDVIRARAGFLGFDLFTSLAGAQTARVASFLLLCAAKLKGRLRIVRMPTQTGQNLVSLSYGGFQRLPFSAVLFIGKVAGEMHLVTAQRYPPPLK